MTPTPETFDALAALEHDANWRRVRDWLTQELADQDRFNRTADAPELFRGQGRAQVLAEFLQHASTARDRLEAISRRQKQNQGGYPQ